MKQRQLFFVLILFFAIPLKVYSQNTWFENGATWVHSTSNMLYYGYLETKVQGDTIINGQLCKKLVRNYKLYDRTTDAFYYAGKSNDLYVYAESNGEKTYIYNNDTTNFELLFDMSKTAGETVTYPYPPLVTSLWSMCPDNTYSVTANGTKDFNGQTLKYYALKETPTTNYMMNGDIVERIGSTSAYFYSLVGDYSPMQPAICMFGQTSMNFADRFRCYRDSLVDYKDENIQKYYGDNCYYPGVDPSLSVKESSTSKNDFIMYPNPADKVIEIRRNENSDTTAKVTNAVGQLTTTYEIKGKKAEINVSSLPTGIYFISIDGTTKKMIINHK